MSLRRRIETSKTVAAGLGALGWGYLAFCDRNTDWQVEGLTDLQDALSEGPILLVMWHSRSVMGAIHWPVADGPLSSLYNRSPVGRISGAVQRRAGLQAVEMSRTRSNRSASREVLRRFRDGVSIGMTGDGPLGPAHEVLDAPLDWARTLGAPVFCYAFSTTRGRQLNTWDKMLVPLPFGRGAKVFARFDGTLPRRATGAELEATREALRCFMDTTTARADALVGKAAES
ncbi:lysophospholipid acyltransferase family protein [Marivita geojedonensis]|uniref:DUF374 domain-containing protein n=1 Tax=Marivita geojedonensis TaxID=1123756 RepID=A0A1X4NEJ7_9RHOB|nr:DUF374 domain-containing protein [Marivita geojedonensis]OSQ45264.1 hypothetical protein MGEO_18250 [Marivita geojedonensis]PRY73887.1 hypothetical protein CLV76_1268 [Marivita geojedonensis]